MNGHVRAVALLPLIALAGCGAGAGIDGDSIARLVYLGAILAALSVSVFGSRMGLTSVLRGIAIWLAIILLLAAAWQYRDLVIPGNGGGATVVKLNPEIAASLWTA